MEAIVTCNECGLKFFRGAPEDELNHQQYHDEAVNGPQAGMADGYHTVDCRSPLSVRQATQRAAVLAKRDAHYDFPAYVADDDDPETRAVILVQNGHIVALIVTSNQECRYTIDLEQYSRAVNDVALDEIEQHNRTAIEMIWVLKSHRGSAVAKELVAALSKELHIGSNELAHTLPFTEAALRFWQKLGITRAYVV